MKLKVCGMKYQDNIEQVAALLPDYLGFIFYEKSSRYFDSQHIPSLPESIKKTGVFVNAELEFVAEKILQHNLQAVQLHGEESATFCSNLKHLFEQKRPTPQKTLEIIKVFSIKEQFNFNVLQPYNNVCDYFLFDTKGKLPGGNGYTFNWDVLNEYPSTKPFFLSGGIGIDEVEKINTFMQSKASKYCYALDINSKFEIKPGLKNIELLKTFKDSVITKPKNNTAD